MYHRYCIAIFFTKFFLRIIDRINLFSSNDSLKLICLVHLLVLHHKCYDFAPLGSNWGQHSRIFKLIPYNFFLYVKKTSHFPTKTGRFMVAETGLEPAASGL